MKNFFFIIIGLVLFSTKIFSQDQKITIRTGTGYYADVMGMYDGPVFWLEGGFRLKTGFYLNGRVSVASIDWIMNEGAFESYKTIALRQMADVIFSRPVRLKGEHFLEPGIGLKLKREYHMYPDIYIQDISGTSYIFTKYSYIF